MDSSLLEDLYWKLRDVPEYLGIAYLAVYKFAWATSLMLAMVVASRLLALHTPTNDIKWEWLSNVDRLSTVYWFGMVGAWLNLTEKK